MKAELTVAVGEDAVEPGLAKVILTLIVEGPNTLEVEEPRLGDPTNAWQAKHQKNTKNIQNKRMRWRRIIHLTQSKKGAETLPDVALRFREGPDAKWQEAKWVDILKQMRDGPHPPLPSSHQVSWLWRWGLPIAFGVVVLLLFAWMVKRRRSRQPPPLPPDQWALHELQHIEQTLMPPHGDAETFHTQLSQIVRRYLAERYVPHALQQTTTEFLDAMRQTPQVSAEQQQRLRDLFERCDLAKFARADTSPEECQRSAEMAHELVKISTTNNTNEHE